MLVTAFAVLVPVGAAPAAQRKSAAAKKAAARKQLRKELRRHPAALRRRSFLRRAALVNFKLPVTIRLRNACMTENGHEPRARRRADVR